MAAAKFGHSRAPVAHFSISRPRGFTEHALLKQRGCLYPARADQHRQLEVMVDDIRASGGHVASISRQEALARVPLLRADYVAAAALDSDAMDIDVDALEQGFLRGARAAGTALLTKNWLTQAQRRGGFWCLYLNDGGVSAPVLIEMPPAPGRMRVAVICGAYPIGLQAAAQSGAVGRRACRYRYPGLAGRDRCRRAIKLQPRRRQADAVAGRRNPG